MSDQTSIPSSFDPEAHGGPPQRLAWLLPLGLAALLGTVFFFRLGDDIPLRTHEALLAGTARNMLLNRPVQLADGSRPSPYLVPNFNDSPRLRKTPLAYWMVVPVAWAVGEVNAWSARLPSALAALATVLMVAAVLARRYDRLTAFVGAAALATMVGFLMNARLAIADMPMTCFCTASLLALWMGVEGGGRRRFRWFIFAGAFGGLAMLAKGPAPLLVLWLPYLVAAAVCVVRQVRRVARPACPAVGASAGTSPRPDKPAVPQAADRARPNEWAWTLGGAAAAIAVFLAVVLPWHLYVYQHDHDALKIWMAESVDRAAGEFGHEEPVYFYLLRLPMLAAPWTVFFAYGLVLAARRAWRDVHDRAWLLFIGAWLVGTLIGFSLSAGKQDHYILPLLPAVGIYTALGLRRVLGHGGIALAQGFALSGRMGKSLLAGHGAVLAACGAVCLAVYVFLLVEPEFNRPDVGMPGLKPSGLLGGMAIVGGVAAGVLAVRWRLGWSLAALVATFAAIILWVSHSMIGPQSRASGAADFARVVRQVVPDGAPLFAYGRANQSVIFYVGRAMPPLADPAGVEKEKAAGRTFYLIIEAGPMEQLMDIPGLVRVHHEADPYRPDEGLWLLKAPGRSP
jgi:4-amino-4-deoxy-L-arabinose transferase-like glycosyltransferase